jgi:hypothetical protein
MYYLQIAFTMLQPMARWAEPLDVKSLGVVVMMPVDKPTGSTMLTGVGFGDVSALDCVV